MKKIAFIFLGSFLVLVGTAKFAISDIVILKDGRQIEGIVEEQTDKMIKFRIKIGELTFVPSEINSVITSSQKDNEALEKSWTEPKEIAPVPAPVQDEALPLQKEESAQVTPGPASEKPAEGAEKNPAASESGSGVIGDTLPELPVPVPEPPKPADAEKSSGPENAPIKTSPTGVIQGVTLPEPPKPEPTSIKWITDYDNGMISASQNEMTIIIDFYADWCDWCQKLDYEVYASPEVIDAGSGFTWIKVNVDDKKDLVAKYNIERYPTVLFLNSDGKELDRIKGFVGKDVFLNKMKEVLTKK